MRLGPILRDAAEYGVLFAVGLLLLRHRRTCGTGGGCCCGRRAVTDPTILNGECREAMAGMPAGHLARERIARELRPGTHVPEEGHEALPLFAEVEGD